MSKNRTFSITYEGFSIKPTMENIEEELLPEYVMSITRMGYKIITVEANKIKEGN